jgi:hypothetical protein
MLAILAFAAGLDRRLNRNPDAADRDRPGPASIDVCAAKGRACQRRRGRRQGQSAGRPARRASPKPPIAAPRKANAAVVFDSPGSVMEPREKSDPDFAAKIAADPDHLNPHAGSSAAAWQASSSAGWRSPTPRTRPPTNAPAQRWPAFPNSTEASDMKKTLALAADAGRVATAAKRQERGARQAAAQARRRGPEAQGRRGAGPVPLQRHPLGKRPHRPPDLQPKRWRRPSRRRPRASTPGARASAGPIWIASCAPATSTPTTAKGLDFYDVGTGAGAGGLGIWQDNKLWTSRNWKSWKMIQNGPDVAKFSVDYAPWPVDVDRKVWETRTFSLPLGTNFTRMVSTISSDKPGPLVVGIGITKRKRASGSGVFKKDLAPGRVTFWEPADPDKGSMAIALMVDPKSVVEVRQDFDNYLVLIKVEPASRSSTTWARPGIRASTSTRGRVGRVCDGRRSLISIRSTRHKRKPPRGLGASRPRSASWPSAWGRARTAPRLLGISRAA